MLNSTMSSKVKTVFQHIFDASNTILKRNRATCGKPSPPCCPPPSPPCCPAPSPPPPCPGSPPPSPPRCPGSPPPCVKPSPPPCDPPDKGSWKMWRNISLGVVVPTVIIATIINILLVSMCEIEPPPYVPYEYMYRRVKKYPWGDGIKTFFHNPHVNALPDGYEPGHGPTQAYNEEDDVDA